MQTNIEVSRSIAAGFEHFTFGERERERERGGREREGGTIHGSLSTKRRPAFPGQSLRSLVPSSFAPA